jgi:hypothetical protein
MDANGHEHARHDTEAEHRDRVDEIDTEDSGDHDAQRLHADAGGQAARHKGQAVSHQGEQQRHQSDGTRRGQVIQKAGKEADVHHGAGIEGNGQRHRQHEHEIERPTKKVNLRREGQVQQDARHDNARETTAGGA